MRIAPPACSLSLYCCLAASFGVSAATNLGGEIEHQIPVLPPLETLISLVALISLTRSPLTAV